MEFDFAKYTEITDYAFKINPEYKKSGYIRLFICPDVWDFWFVRILQGYNEEYEKEDTTTGMQSFACSGDTCELVDLT